MAVASANKVRASVSLFSLHKCVSDMLDNPEKYGSPKNQVWAHVRDIWKEDGSTGLTSEVHSILLVSSTWALVVLVVLRLPMLLKGAAMTPCLVFDVSVNPDCYS
jgi:hypothetical protein